MKLTNNTISRQLMSFQTKKILKNHTILIQRIDLKEAFYEIFYYDDFFLFLQHDKCCLKRKST